MELAGYQHRQVIAVQRVALQNDADDEQRPAECFRVRGQPEQQPGLVPRKWAYLLKCFEW